MKSKGKRGLLQRAGQQGMNPETFRMLMEHATEGSMLLNGKGTVAYASPAACRLLGYTSGELEGIDIREHCHLEEQEMLRSHLSEVLQKPGLRIEAPPCRIRHKDGTFLWIESTATNVLGAPEAQGIVFNFRDMTRIRAVHEELVYANRLYDFLRQINHAIVHTTDEGSLFGEACRIAVEHGGFRYAWIGIPDRSSRKVRMAASAGSTARDALFFSDYAYDCNGPISHVLDGKDYFAVDHIQSRKNKEFIAYANDRGFQSAIVLPLRKSAGVFAVLNLYAAEKSFFNSTEIALLSEASADLSFALDALEREQERAKAVRKLQQKELRLSQAQEMANVGSWERDLATGASYWSEEALRICGFDPGKGAPTYEEWISCIHPQDRSWISEAVKKAEKECQNCSLYHRILTPGGTIRYVHTQSLFEFDESGAPTGLTGIVHDMTDMRKQEQALLASEDAFRESEFRYRQIVENAHEGIWLLDRENRTLFANGKMCQILECAPEMMPGAELQSFIPQGSIDLDSAADAYNAVIRFKTRTGRLIWANVAFGPLAETGRLALVSDITEKKELEELLENATAMARIGGYELDIDTGAMSWSPMTRDIHEVDDSFTPTLQQAMAFYKEGASRDALTEAGYKALKEAIPWDLELEIVTARGNTRWVRVIGRSEHHEGRCLKIHGSFQDIDSRKQAELEVLNIAEEKNRILESIGNAFFAVDGQWNITYWNREAERLLGRARSEAIGRNLWELYPEAIGTDYFNFYHKAVRDNAVQQFEARYEPMQIWTEVSAYPSLSGLSVYFKDITERKRTEAERALMTADIVRRNQDLEQFSYIVSHNLRGPVANIMGIASELESGSYTPQLEKLLKEGLSVSARRLDEVIIDLNGILQLRKNIGESREPVCLQQLVDAIRDSIMDIVHLENATITTDFSAVSELVSVKSYLHSIFYNLITNSIKYRQAELDPVIKIKSERHGGKVTVTFQDNGLGIDLDTKRDQVFRLYKRFHAHVEGRGVGLYMVRAQAEMLGGSIAIASEVGTGTTITLELYL